MKPNRNMIAPCPFFPHDVGASDCGSAAFPVFPIFFSRLPFAHTRSRVRFRRTLVFPPPRACTGRTVFVCGDNRRDTRAYISSSPPLENPDRYRLRV